MTRRYRMARPEEHRALMVQDAQAFGDSTTSVSIDRLVARTRVEELRVLEEDGNRLGLLLARNQPVFWGGRPVPASQVSGLSVGAEHRGRGVATELLQAYLAEVHERGGAVDPDEAADLVERCAELAAQLGAEVDARARSASETEGQERLL
mgnify:CR=1 FL=1